MTINYQTLCGIFQISLWSSHKLSVENRQPFPEKKHEQNGSPPVFKRGKLENPPFSWMIFR